MAKMRSRFFFALTIMALCSISSADAIDDVPPVGPSGPVDRKTPPPREHPNYNNQDNQNDNSNGSQYHKQRLPTEEEYQRANELIDQGVDFYNKENYEEALRYYEAAKVMLN